MGSVGSYSQVVVGGMLLIIAFFFGRYINQQPITQKTTAESEELVGALESPGTATAAAKPVVDDAEAQKSLRERILSQRAQSKLSNLNIKPVESNRVAKNEKLTQPNFTDAIVEPDFSHLQSFESAPAIKTPKLPDPGTSGEAPKADELTRPNQMQRMNGRFSINRPTPDRMQPQRNIDNRYDSIAERVPRATNARPVVNKQNDFAGSKATQPTQATAENSRYRLVPVRERRGNWNPEPKEYVKYTTVFGDTLHNLSTKFFGSPDRYLDIYLANRKIIKSPSEVPVNTEIRIPVMK